jgi:type IV secretory pathway VirB2 component (pilin)
MISVMRKAAVAAAVLQTGRTRRYATLAALAGCAVPRLALAQAVTGGTSPATMLNNIATFILGPFGQSLAVLAVICIGVAWMFGRMSLGLLAGIIGGIIIMFGAAFLGQTLTGGAGGAG